MFRRRTEAEVVGEREGALDHGQRWLASSFVEFRSIRELRSHLMGGGHYYSIALFVDWIGENDIGRGSPVLYSERTVAAGLVLDPYFNLRGTELLVVAKGKISVNGTIYGAGKFAYITAGEIINISVVEQSELVAIAFSTLKEIVHVPFERFDNGVKLVSYASRADIEPLVSIVIAARNIEHHIAKCLLSCIAQDYRNLEIIVVVDSSADATEEKVVAFQKMDSRIKLLKTSESKGVNFARKLGLNAGSGEYYMIIDGDDWVAVDAVSSLLQSVRQSSAEVVAFGFDYFDDLTGKHFNFWFPPPIVNDRPVAYGFDKAQQIALLNNTVWQFFFSSSLKDRVIQSLVEIPVYEDVPFFILMTERPTKLAVCNRIIYHYRRNRKGQVTGDWQGVPDTKKRAFLKIAIESCIDPVLQRSNFRESLVLLKLAAICTHEFDRAQQIQDVPSAERWRATWESLSSYIIARFPPESQHQLLNRLNIRNL